MTITADKLKEVLDQLDKKDDNLWTDSGTPRISAVRALAKDDTITRAVLDTLLPGYSRNPPVAPVETPVEAGGPRVEPIIATDAEADDPVAQIETDMITGIKMAEDEVRAILNRRVSDATANLEKAQMAVRDANTAVARALTMQQRAKADLAKRFPPMSASDAIKAHIAAGQRKLLEDVTGSGPVNGINQVDLAMSRQNRRGFTRPTRPVQNASTKVA